MGSDVDSTYPAPRTPRQQVMLSAEISGFDGVEASRHRIKDLSMSGARVDGAGTLHAGATVVVSVGRLEAIGATVVWVKDGVAGLKFAAPINLDAARSKTMIAQVTRGDANATAAAHAAEGDAIGRPINAGWMPGLTNPYRRK